MPKIDARLPKGMRDFLPSDVLKRQYVFGVITDVFKTYGFEPIETPVLEMEETLMGKYGAEAEKLIFKAQHPGGKEELALRYDLTVPLSRYVSMHENDLTLPFRRYHIAPVWRAERPQKGRYREFYQCDADIVGIGDMSADAEIVSLVTTVLRRLGFADFKVKVNNRKILTGIGVYAGVPDAQLGDLYRSVDKLDKIGLENVGKELRESGIEESVVSRMLALLEDRGEGGLDSLRRLAETLNGVEQAQTGIRELEELTGYMEAMGVPFENIELDYAMVRGLSYYTGPIFETIITKPDNLGSVTGGGRYDDLIGLFRKESLPTTGTALGVERIIDLMELLDLYPPELTGTVVQVLVTVFGAETQAESLKLASQLRAAGIRTEAFLQPKKAIGKQIQYADKKGVAVAAFLGADEIQNGVVKFKRLRDGAEVTVPRAQATDAARNLLSGK
jgi:histidyl-tRNA synthetase